MLNLAHRTALVGTITSSGIVSGDGTPPSTPEIDGQIYGDGHDPFITGDDRWLLMGYWNPNNLKSYAGTGVAYFNLVSGGKNLELKNGIELVTGSNGLKSFEPDGTDDYIGQPTAAYGAPFKLDLGSKWTICFWVRVGTGGYTKIDGTVTNNLDVSNPLVTFGNVLDNGYEINHEPTSPAEPATSPSRFVHYMHGDGYGETSDREGDSFGDFQPETGSWYFLTSTNYCPLCTTIKTQAEVYVDGNYLAQTNLEGEYESPAGFMYPKFGFSWGESDEGAISGYIVDKYRFGEIMIYSGALGTSQVRQNYLATKDNYNTQFTTQKHI